MMRKKRNLYIFFCMLFVVLGGFYLYSDWSNIFSDYTLPKYPGVERLGSNYGFPRAINIALENENSAIFLGNDLIGGIFYRYDLESHKMTEIFPDFRSASFQLTQDRKLIGFTGWRKEKSPIGKLWISTLDGIPSMVGEKTLSNYDLSYLGWSLDNKSMLIKYDCKLRTRCLGNVDLQTQEISEIFEFSTENNPATNFEWISPDQIAFDIKKDVNNIEILDINKKELKAIPIKAFASGRLKKLPSRNWLVGIMVPTGSIDEQLFFMSNNFECLKLPFKELKGISYFDVYETNDDIKILLQDYYGLMYLMSLKESLKPGTMDQLFSCNN